MKKNIILYFVNIINEAGEIIKIFASQDQAKARYFMDAYKTKEANNCVLEYKMTRYEGGRREVVAHYYE